MQGLVGSSETSNLKYLMDEILLSWSHILHFGSHNQVDATSSFDSVQTAKSVSESEALCFFNVCCLLIECGGNAFMAVVFKICTNENAYKPDDEHEIRREKFEI